MWWSVVAQVAAPARRWLAPGSHLARPDPPPPRRPPQTFSSGKYAAPGGERSALLKHIAAAPRGPWPSGGSFTFRNAARVFGAPQLDAAARPESGGAALEALLEELQSAKF